MKLLPLISFLLLPLLGLGSAVMSPPPAALPSDGGKPTSTSSVPEAVTMNEGAGAGMLLFLNIRIENHPETRFFIDTGSPNTTVPTSFEPTLGKRLGSRHFSILDGSSEVEHFYAAPKLYLGNVQLMTDTRVGSWGTVGVLGMDCLRHYCLQLDFESRTLRFLHPKKVDFAALGKAFSLATSPYVMVKHAGLFQQNDADLLIDTGCPFDAYLPPALFKHTVQERHGDSVPFFKNGTISGTAPGIALFADVVWDNETYTNLVIGRATNRKTNLLGLRFLGRHLVTFDFPAGKMYLKKTSGEPLSAPIPHKPKTDS